MDVKIREAQRNFLEIFSKVAHNFALSGGTALELYYLNHRFSADLDFFSSKYEVEEINRLVSEFEKHRNIKMELESEFLAAGKAKVRFYTTAVKGSERPLKIDFVEDVLFERPVINKIDKVRVYDVKNIYLQKMVAIAGVNPEFDEIGREMFKGRRAARDIFDVYMLSKKIIPLSRFLLEAPAQIQRGMVHWYRTFSREDVKLALLDLDIYDKKFNAKEMLVYLEKEIRKFIKEVLE